MDTPHDHDLTLLGQTNFRNIHHPFGIRRADRRAHLYVIGKTGVGKSTFLEQMIRQDIQAGEGLALLDPHGDTVERIWEFAMQHRPEDVIYFNVPDTAHTLGFNPLEHVLVPKRPLAASGLLEVFKKLWPEFWGPRMEHILRNAVLSVLDLPFTTMADILRLLDDPAYRKQALPYIQNAQVKQFWQKEYEYYSVRFRQEAIAPIQNKVGAFLADPLLRAILTQSTSSFNLRQVMDEGKILLVNLAKGKIGQDSAALLGALLVAQLNVAGLYRADMLASDRRDFYVYLDEFQTFSTGSLATMLSELRKYHVNLILAHQYMSQLEPSIRDAILGNVGTIISFRVGPVDAEILAKELYPVFTADDLMNLPNYHMYLKMMIDGTITPPFSARGMMAENPPDRSV